MDTKEEIKPLGQIIIFSLMVLAIIGFFFMQQTKMFQRSAFLNNTDTNSNNITKTMYAIKTKFNNCDMLIERQQQMCEDSNAYYFNSGKDIMITKSTWDKTNDKLMFYKEVMLLDKGVKEVHELVFTYVGKNKYELTYINKGV